MRFQVQNSSRSKTFILFVKIARLCAAHKRMKITHDKKSGSHIFSVRLGGREGLGGIEMLTFFNEIFWILDEEESHKYCEEGGPD